MKPTTSTAGPRQPDSASTPLTQLPVRELLQQLAACADALRADRAGTDAAAPAPERLAILEQQAHIVRELRRRRHHREPNTEGRRRSAAWPPPPW